MSQFEIWIGPPGCGKSHQIAQEIRNSVFGDPFGSPLYWVVPDPVAYTAERKLLSEVPSVIRAEVITLQRLAQRIWRAAGHANASFLTPSGRRLLLSQVYHEHQDTLGPLRRERPTVAFLDWILDAFTDMFAEEIDLEQLDGALESAAAALKGTTSRTFHTAGGRLLSKLQDICTLYGAYKRGLTEGGFLDESRWLSECAQVTGYDETLKNATIYLDGFVEFNPQTLTFILALADHVGRIVITLPVDSAWLETGLRSNSSSVSFESPITEMMMNHPRPSSVMIPQALYSFHELREHAKERELPLRVVQFTDFKRCQDVPELLHLATGLQNQETKPFTGEAHGIQLSAAESPRAEVVGVAEEIKSLLALDVAEEKDIAVVVPNLDTYAPYIDEVFRQFEIPIAANEFPSLATYPLSKFLTASIEVAKEGYSTRAVAKYLRTEFTGLGFDEADWLEGYLAKYDIRGERAYFSHEQWSYARDVADNRFLERAAREDERADKLRRHVARILGPFTDSVRQAELTPKALADEIWSLFERVDAKHRVATWMVNEDAQQNPLEASVHEQAWLMLINLLNDLAVVQPTTVYRSDNLLHILETDLMQQTLSNIPTGLNQVQLMDVRRAVAWEAPYVFILGATDQQFPPRVSTATGLLQDEERQAFYRLFGQPLGQLTRERAWAMQATVLFALTRATKRVFMSYPISSLEGREEQPSRFFQRLKDLFPDIAEVFWRANADDGTRNLVLSPEAALSLAIREIQGVFAGETAHYLRDIADWIQHEPGRADLARQALAGFSHAHIDKLLTKSLAAALYGQPLRLTAYQLESFAACAYQHFVQFGLRVEEEDQGPNDSRLRGTLVHDVLEAFVLRQRENPEEWRQFSDDQAVAVMREIFDEVLAHPKQRVWMGHAVRKYQADEVWRIVREASVVLTRHLRHGQFAPHSLELAFGPHSDDALPSFSYQTSGGLEVEIRGRIDRVDVASIEDQVFFRIMDYKSRRHDLSPTDIVHGLRIQLPLYAWVLEQYGRDVFGAPAKAVGMFYLPITKRVKLEAVPPELQEAYQAMLESMRASGYMTADDTVISAMDARLQEGTGTELFAKTKNKNGSIPKQGPAMEDAEWEGILRAVRTHVDRAAEAVMAGTIAPHPYRKASLDTACMRCGFRALCHLDPSTDGHRFRQLRTISREELGLESSREEGTN